MIKKLLITTALVLPLAYAGVATAQTAKKPNIIMIMADDVGIWNISAYHRGMMGGSTPNIDRIATEGALFTDYYAQQSCTAGRAAFILGQTPFRTGLLTVGLPAAKEGVQDKDPTIAELLKPLGYATAQIGKNHLGDRNEFLPTVHGFDEFYGILYHLNAMEEPYEPDYPKAPNFRANFGPRNIVDCKSTTVDDATIDPRWGKVGKQVIVDGGPLPPHPNMDPSAKTNMEDVDDELVRRSVDFMDRSVKANKPFFLWHNSTRAHVWTHLAPKWQNKSGYGLYADAMMELDAEVGSILKKGTSLASPTTRSSSLPATTARKPSLGRTVATRHSGAKRARPSRAVSACPWSSSGPARSSPVVSSTTSPPARTSCRRSWPPPATPISRKNY